MPDFSLVAKFRELTLEEAADFLLEGQLKSNSLDYKRKWIMEDQLITAIKSGRLQAIDQFPGRNDVHPKIRYRINPSALKAWYEAEKLNEIVEANPSSSSQESTATNLSSIASTKTKRPWLDNINGQASNRGIKIEHPPEEPQTMARDQVFISYSHDDEIWKNRLVSQLGVLEREGLLSVWEDRQIAAGENWLPEIEAVIQSCNVALLLISAQFLTSKFICGKEVPALLQRRQQGGVRIIPVILKPCAWTWVSWLKWIQARPKDGKPLSGMSEHDAETALAVLAEEVADLLAGRLRAPI